jgi:hypothetical protein
LLRVPDHLIGSHVRCPNCKATFTAGAEGLEPVSEALEEVGPSREKPREREERVTDRERPREREERVTDRSDAARRRRQAREEIEEEQAEARERRQARARARVVPPAIALMITGALGVAWALVLLVLNLLGSDKAAYFGPPGGERGAYYSNLFHGVWCPLMGLTWSTILVLGGVQMMRLQMYTPVMIACIFAMIPMSHCCLVGIPVGIWALIVLNNHEVKASFP